MQEFIYLLREREFVRLHENVYKLGRTSRRMEERFVEYSKQSELMLVLAVDDSKLLETLLLRTFRTTFRPRVDIGREYFEGNPHLMMEAIFAGTRMAALCLLCNRPVTGRHEGTVLCCGPTHYACHDAKGWIGCSKCQATCPPPVLYVCGVELYSVFKPACCTTLDPEKANVIAVYGDDDASLEALAGLLRQGVPTYLFINPSLGNRAKFTYLNKFCVESTEGLERFHAFMCFRPLPSTPYVEQDTLQWLGY